MWDNTGKACERCRFPSSQTYDYIDRHGDIHELCATCYHVALHPVESPDLARRDRKVAAVLAVTVVAVLLISAGCTGFQPRVVPIQIAGRTVFEHIDTDDAPAACGDRSAWDGCYMTINGTGHIWRSSLAHPDTIAHERAHPAGMRHTAWTHDFTGRACATVILPGLHYKAGQRICVNRNGSETIYEAAP